MLGQPILRLVVVITAALLLVVALACNDSPEFDGAQSPEYEAPTVDELASESPVDPDAEANNPSGGADTGSSSTARPVTVIAYGDPRIAFASSLMEMASPYETIIVGRVEEVLVPYDPRSGFLGIATPEPPRPLPSGHPKAGTIGTPTPEELARPPGRLSTTYSVEVLRSIRPSSLAVGELIPVTQGGGVWDGEEHRISDDPVLELGATYLMFLEKDELPNDIVERRSLGDFWPEAAVVIMR
ncbi:MAG: hypothetical protein ACE5EQ_12195, partial [Phycisphaerae bacterium]